MAPRSLQAIYDAVTGRTRVCFFAARTWTYIKKYSSPLCTASLFLFQGYCVSNFLPAGLASESPAVISPAMGCRRGRAWIPYVLYTTLTAPRHILIFWAEASSRNLSDCEVYIKVAQHKRGQLKLDCKTDKYTNTLNLSSIGPAETSHSCFPSL